MMNLQTPTGFAAVRKEGIIMKSNLATMQHPHADHLTHEEIQQNARKLCDEIAEQIEQEALSLRFRRRHAGFLRAYLVTNHIAFAVAYAHRLIHHGGGDVAIGHAMERVLANHYEI